MRIYILVTMMVLGLVVMQPANAAFENTEGQELQCSCTCFSQGSVPASTDNQSTSTVSIAFVPSMVVISEFVSDPITGDREWVELYNRSDEVLDLDGWQLLEGSEQVTQLGGAVVPGDFIVFEKTSLNNGGDQLVLRAPDGTVIDSVTYGDFDDGDVSDNAPATQDPFSVIRKDVAFDYNDDAREFVVTTFVTKEKANVLIPIDTGEVAATSVDDGASVEDPVVETIPVYDNAMTVTVTEFFPNPVGSDTDGGEWIELFNAGTADVSLLGWMVDDEAGGSSPYVFEDDVSIPAGGYVVLTNDVTDIQLNNTADKVRLMHHDETVVDVVGYSSVVEGQSYALVNEDWIWTNEPTPGEKNVLPQVVVANDAAGEIADVVEIPLVALKEVYTLPLETEVRVEGVVIAAPGVLGSRVMYVDGLQIYNGKSEWPEVALSDAVTIEGKVSESNGERRLLASSLDQYTVGERGDAIEPLVLTAEELGAANLGRLVVLSGTALEKDGSKVIFGDETEEFVVYFRQSTGASSKNVTTGDQYDVVGVVSVYQGEYRLLPRSVEDIVLHEAVVELPIEDSVAAGLFSEPEVVSAPPSAKASPLFILVVALLASVVAAIGGVAWWQRDKIKAFIHQFRVNKTADIA